MTRIVPTENRFAHRTFAVGSRSAARVVRVELADALRDLGISANDICNTELVFSDLVGNIIRHAGEEAEVALEVSSDNVVLHILDRGPGFTFHAKLLNDVRSESGRKLYIAKMYTRELSVTPRRDGGSHARAVLMQRARIKRFSNL